MVWYISPSANCRHFLSFFSFNRHSKNPFQNLDASLCRLALMQFQILTFLEKCRLCITKPNFLGLHSLNNVCMVCILFYTKFQIFWYILWHHGLPYDVLQIIVEIGRHMIATAIASVIVVRLRQVFFKG